MGATLRYAKVVDGDHLQAHGGLSPSTDSVVLLDGPAPSPARDFEVLRAWDDIDRGGIEETWRIEDPHGQVLYTGAPRTVLPDQGGIADEIGGVVFEYDDTGYQLVLQVDDREVARADFRVAVADADDVATVPESPRDVNPADAVEGTDSQGVEAADASPDTMGGADGASAQGLDTSPLDADEQRVFEAVAAIETEGTPGFVEDVAGRAGLEVDTVRRVLSELTGPRDLVQTISTGLDDQPDLGMRYRVKARP